MFEDTLAYRTPTALARSRPELLAFDLEEDARQFYVRMAADVGVLAGRVDRSPDAAFICRALLEALTAAPSARAGYWRRLYRKISLFAAGYNLEAVPENVRGEAVLALGRMRQFLRENVDLADALPVEDFARIPLSQVGA